MARESGFIACERDNHLATIRKTPLLAHNSASRAGVSKSRNATSGRQLAGNNTVQFSKRLVAGDEVMDAADPEYRSLFLAVAGSVPGEGSRACRKSFQHTKPIRVFAHRIGWFGWPVDRAEILSIRHDCPKVDFGNGALCPARLQGLRDLKRLEPITSTDQSDRRTDGRSFPTERSLRRLRRYQLY